MVTAIILIEAERQRIAPAAQEILELEGITEVYSVAGEYDLVAIARVSKNEELAKLVTEDLINVPGLIETNTLIAFRQYSNHELDRLFNIGE